MSNRKWSYRKNDSDVWFDVFYDTYEEAIIRGFEDCKLKDTDELEVCSIECERPSLPNIGAYDLLRMTDICGKSDDPKHMDNLFNDEYDIKPNLKNDLEAVIKYHWDKISDYFADWIVKNCGMIENVEHWYQVSYAEYLELKNKTI